MYLRIKKLRPQDLIYNYIYNIVYFPSSLRSRTLYVIKLKTSKSDQKNTRFRDLLFIIINSPKLQTVYRRVLKKFHFFLQFFFWSLYEFSSLMYNNVFSYIFLPFLFKFSVLSINIWLSQNDQPASQVKTVSKEERN